MSPNAEGGGWVAVAESQPMSTAVHRSLINFRDLTPYLITVCDLWVKMYSYLPAVWIRKYYFRIINPDLRIQIRKANLLRI
jgi:hypothetical protein